MRFLLDRCAGLRLAEWLRDQGHDVVEAREPGADPGDRALLERAAAEDRILVTIDTDFGEFVYVRRVPHAGLVRLPNVPAERRIALCGHTSATDHTITFSDTRRYQRQQGQGAKQTDQEGDTPVQQKS